MWVKPRGRHILPSTSVRLADASLQGVCSNYHQIKQQNIEAFDVPMPLSAGWHHLWVSPKQLHCWENDCFMIWHPNSMPKWCFLQKVQATGEANFSVYKWSSVKVQSGRFIYLFFWIFHACPPSHWHSLLLCPISTGWFSSPSKTVPGTLSLSQSLARCQILSVLSAS